MESEEEYILVQWNNLREYMDVGWYSRKRIIMAFESSDDYKAVYDFVSGIPSVGHVLVLRSSVIMRIE